MAKEMEHEAPKKSPKKHLHQVITESVHDKDGKHTGYVHHHVYKAKATDHHAEPAKPAGVSSDAAEAGEHVTDQFAQQEAAGGGEAEPGEAGGGAPTPAAGADAGAPEPGM